MGAAPFPRVPTTPAVKRWLKTFRGVGVATSESYVNRFMNIASMLEDIKAGPHLQDVFPRHYQDIRTMFQNSQKTVTDPDMPATTGLKRKAEHVESASVELQKLRDFLIDECRIHEEDLRSDDQLCRVFYGCTLQDITDQVSVVAQKAIDQIRKDPYMWLWRRFDVYFKKADKIYLDFGGDPRSPLRVTAHISFVVGEVVNDGHTFMDRDDLFRRVRSELGFDVRDLWEEIDREKNGFFVEDDEDRVFTPDSYKAEQELPGILYTISQMRSDGRFLEKLSRLDEAFPNLDSDQKPAVNKILSQGGLHLICGFAGSGKTEGLRAIAWATSGSSHIHAFTGKAVMNAKQRVQDIEGVELSTINQYIGRRNVVMKYYGEKVPGGGYDIDDRWGSEKDDSKVKEYVEWWEKIEVLVFEEASMISLVLLHKALKIRPPRLQCVVFMGDSSQLPPIGAGEPFRIMCDGIRHLVSKFTQNHRQKSTEGHAIEELRLLAEKGILPHSSPGVIDTIDFNSSSEDAWEDFAVNQVQGLLRGPDNDEKTQVISPTNAICDVINNTLQWMENDQAHRVLYEGERVLLYHKNGSKYRSKQAVVVAVDSIAGSDEKEYTVKYTENRVERETKVPRYHLREGGNTGGFLVKDRVVVTKNMHDLGLVNGSEGIIKSFAEPKRDRRGKHGDTVEAVVEIAGGAEHVIPFRHMALAYCMTVHKMQGSQQDRVIFVVGDWCGDDRRLTYTAMTRFCKRMVMICKSLDKLRRTCEKTVKDRRSLFRERMAEVFSTTP